MSEPTRSTMSFLERIAARLKSSHLLMVMSALFVLDLFIPDPIFLVDEIMLGLITILVARWQGRPKAAADSQAEASSTKPPPKNVTPEPGIGR